MYSYYCSKAKQAIQFRSILCSRFLYKTYKNWNVQNWVLSYGCKTVLCITGRTRVSGVWEHDPEENIWHNMEEGKWGRRELRFERVVRGRKMRLAVYVARVGVIRLAHIIFWLENLNGRGQLEDLNVDWKIILKWNVLLVEHVTRAWTGFMLLWT